MTDADFHMGSMVSGTLRREDLQESKELEQNSNPFPVSYQKRKIENENFEEIFVKKFDFPKVSDYLSAHWIESSKHSSLISHTFLNTPHGKMALTPLFQYFSMNTKPNLL